ncbi:MAG: type II secretion system F family protein [Puniceicoccales bacterium]|jgi:type II secretory pathway component PulF|nr:type II secretion system F family protein [Puniceicoccales bacterium]
MSSFSYIALDSANRSCSGTLDAEDRRSAARKLAGQGLRILSLQAATGTGTGIARHTGHPVESTPSESNGGAATPPPSLLEGKVPGKLTQGRLFGPHRTGWDFVDSFYQLHANGLPMGDSVKLLGQRVSEPALRYLCQSLWRDMSEGATLAGAMSRHPVVFDSATLHLVEAGENTGNLVPVLRKVLDSYELRESLRGKVLSSIGYPLSVCAMALGVLGIFVFFLVPRMESIMRNLKGDFPWMVKALMGFADFLIKGGPFIAMALAALAWGFMRWRRGESGRMTSDRWLLRLPVAGAVFLHTETVRMTDLLATLLGSGINATDALRLCERPVANRILRQRLGAGRQMINDGAAFASAFKRHAILPASDVDILAVGENTGSLADTFQSLAFRHVAALDKAIKRLIRVVTGIVFSGTVALVFLCLISIVMTVLSVSKGVLKH